MRNFKTILLLFAIACLVYHLYDNEKKCKKEGFERTLDYGEKDKEYECTERSYDAYKTIKRN